MTESSDHAASPTGRAARVLYLTHRVPYPPDKGDRIRNFHLLRQLAARSEVWLGCLADEPVADETTAELERLCVRVAVVPVSGKRRWVRAGLSLLGGRSLSEGAFSEPGLRKVIRDWTTEAKFDSVVVSASSLVPYLRRDGLQDVPAVVDLVDVDSQKWLDFAASKRGPRRWLYRLEAARVRKLERGLPGWVRAVGLVSRAEADVYDGFTRPGAATVALNGVDLTYFAPASGGRKPPGGATPEGPAGSHRPLAGHSCVFVGALDYLPNVDAAVWFARDVWPLIRANYPDAALRLVGRKPTPEVQALAALPGVEVVGQVPDVRPFVTDSEVVVVPLRLARGLQNKVLEALAMGKAVVAAPPALAALKTEVGTHLLAASSPQEWADAVGGLFENPERRAELGTAARRFVEEHHHWQHCLRPLLDKIVPPSGDRS